MASPRDVAVGITALLDGLWWDGGGAGSSGFSDSLKDLGRSN